MNKKNRNNILIVSPSLKMGGIERALTTLANFYVTKGISVVFLTCLKGDHFYDLDSRIKLVEPIFSHKGGLRKIEFYFKVVRYIKDVVRTEKPDTVLSFGDAFNPLVLLALKNTNVPIFISDRTSPDYNFKFPIQQLKKWLYPKASGYIAQTSRAATYRQREFGSKLKIKVIPNALRDVKLYPEIERQKNILYVGRFAWEKAPNKLLEAFAKLSNAKDWILQMAGSGPMLEEMKKLAKDLRINERVIFLGPVANVDELYAKSSIYVLPSILEGFPNSLCEAMAAGLPSVCFPTIPYEEIFIKPDMGIVCKGSTSEYLTNELQLLIENEDLRNSLGENAKMVSQSLDVLKIGDQYLKFMNFK